MFSISFQHYAYKEIRNLKDLSQQYVPRYLDQVSNQPIIIKSTRIQLHIRIYAITAEAIKDSVDMKVTVAILAGGRLEKWDGGKEK